MNCYVCDNRGDGVPAVAICQNCSVALCREHLDQDLLAVRSHGMSRHQCTHRPVHDAGRRQRPNARSATAST